MTVFEEKLRDFVLKGIPFGYTFSSGIRVAGDNLYGTQTLVLCESPVRTLACKPAFSEEWLFSYEYVDDEAANYLEAVLHRILSKHRKNFKYL